MKATRTTWIVGVSAAAVVTGVAVYLLSKPSTTTTGTKVIVNPPRIPIANTPVTTQPGITQLGP